VKPDRDRADSLQPFIYAFRNDNALSAFNVDLEEVHFPAAVLAKQT
jgi:hypothetical protein